jgi:hypothetical protein
VTCQRCDSGGDPFSATASIDHGSPAANLERLAIKGRSTARNRAFEKGADGERYVGSTLEMIPQSRVIHSRRFGKGDIDHLVIAPSGVWVVDAKNYSGAVTIPYLGTIDQLRVGGRKIDRQLAALRRQVEAVDEAVETGVKVWGALCFVETLWPLTRRLITDRNLAVAPPKRLARYIAEKRTTLPALQERIEVAERLSAVFPAT